MVDIIKTTVSWTGFTGAPGYTNMFWRDFSGGDVDQAMVDGAMTKLDAFLDSWQVYIPASVTYLINPQVEILEDTTGALQGFMNGTPDSSRTGVASGNYSAATGACINWYTGAVRNGRRLRGRTFMVPLAASAFSTDGTLDNSSLSSMRTAAATLISATGTGDLGVWGRPSGPGATDGIWNFATSSSISDKAAVLRSRRD